MNKLLIPIMVIAANAFGQIEVSGRVIDVYNEPLPGVDIMSKNLALAKSDLMGNFSLRVSSDSVELLFRFVGYTAQKLKFKESKTIEVKLREVGDDPVWKLEKHKKPISEETNSAGTIKVYAMALRELNNTEPNSRVVVWHVGENNVLLPLDSLVKALQFTERYPEDDVKFVLKFLGRHSNEDTVHLTKDVEQIAGRPLNDLAIEMIKSNTITIIDQNKMLLKSLTLRDVYWVGKGCTQCCWAGIEFLDPRGKRLFAITNFIC